MPRRRHKQGRAARLDRVIEPLEPRRLLAGQGSLIYNVNQTTDALGPEQFVAAGPSLGYFVGQGYGGVGKEVWRTDGTDSGTYRIKDVWPGPVGSSPSALTIVGQVLYFAADDGVHGSELWRSDGTEAGTTMVQDLTAGSGASSPALLTAVGDTLYFAAGGGTARRVWRLRDADGPAVGAAELVPGQAAGATSGPHYLTAFDDSLLFSTNNSLYRVADAASPATLLTPGGLGSPLGPANLTRFGGQVYFTGSAPGSTKISALYRTDGTAAGTALVSVIDLGATYSTLTNLTASGDRLYFVADDPLAGTPDQL